VGQRRVPVLDRDHELVALNETGFHPKRLIWQKISPRSQVRGWCCAGRFSG
jgi:hypothetical protein